MKKIIALAVFLLAAPALAEPQLNIIATVNDEAITSSDLENRTRLALLGSGIAPNEEVRSHLRGQVLRALVDEHIQLQEAKRLDVTVDEAMIDKEMAAMAARNGQKPEQLPAFFARSGVPISALRDQIRASIAWGMVVQRKLRPQVNITDRDIDAEIARQSAAAGQSEYLAAEIFLPVPAASDEAAVKQNAFRLIDQMSKGVRFSSIAREFSQAPSAVRGGDLGWLRSGQLEPELSEALTKLTPGSLTPPVRTSGGYYILMLRDKRVIQAPAAKAADPAAITYNMRQVILPVAADASPAQIKSVSDKLEAQRSDAKSCSAMERIASKNGDTAKGILGDVKATDVPAALQPVIAGLPDGQPSPLLRNDRGVLFLMICSRTQPAATAVGVDREAIANMLGTQKLELLARRYLRDLRSEAFVDIRG